MKKLTITNAAFGALAASPGGASSQRAQAEASPGIDRQDRPAPKFPDLLKEARQPFLGADCSGADVDQCGSVAVGNSGAE